MDRLPVEILSPIFKIACTDGGETGCALSKVSRYIREASAPMRYNSIALRVARQIRGFLGLLHRYGANGLSAEVPNPAQRGQNAMAVRMTENPTIRVRHLFLADCKSELLMLSVLDEWAADPGASLLSKFVWKVTAKRRYRRSVKLYAGSLQEATKTSAVYPIKEMLILLAPTFVHLCIDQRVITSVFHPPALPALIELTCRLRNFHYMPGLGPSIISDTELPALERVHFVVEHWVNSLFLYLGPQALPPSIKLVRFFTVSDPLQLFSMLTCSPWAVREPLNIIVTRKPERPRTTPSFMASWTPRFELHEWREAASANKSILEKVSVVEDPRFYDYNLEHLYEEWLARVQGEKGCWNDLGTPLSLAGL
jgi:hypothetical protein